MYGLPAPIPYPMFPGAEGFWLELFCAKSWHWKCLLSKSCFDFPFNCHNTGLEAQPSRTNKPIPIRQYKQSQTKGKPDQTQEQLLLVRNYGNQMRNKKQETRNSTVVQI